TRLIVRPGMHLMLLARLMCLVLLGKCLLAHGARLIRFLRSTNKAEAAMFHRAAELSASAADFPPPPVWRNQCLRSRRFSRRRLVPRLQPSAATCPNPSSRAPPRAWKNP